MKTTIIYGSTTGTTETIANMIGDKLGVSAGDIIDAAKLNSDIIAASDLLILGSSTWGDGELQDDWYAAIEVLKSCDLSGKKVAIFGCGDSVSYCDTFCDAMAILFEAVNGRCEVVGAVSSDDYSFDNSKAVADGKFVGLAIDENNEDFKTEERVSNWVKLIGS